MSFIDTLGIDLFSLFPALGAILISLRNWLTLRQGAVINPVEIVNYGIWGIEYKEKKNKALVLPIMLNNDGLFTGMVSNIKLHVTSSAGTKELPIRRRIELEPVTKQRLRSITIDQYRDEGMIEVNPFYPIFIPPKEGISVMVECFDGENIIPLDEQVTFSIHTFYNNQSSSIEFPFSLSSEEFEKSRDHIIWLRN